MTREPAGDMEMMIAGPRQILAPAIGVALLIDHPDRNGRGTFMATAYYHPGFVGLDRFPTISNPGFPGKSSVSPFLLRPRGAEDDFNSLSLEILFADPLPNAPPRRVGAAGQEGMEMSEFLARVVPLLPKLEHWKNYARNGRLESIEIPAELAEVSRKLGLPIESSACRILTASD